LSDAKTELNSAAKTLREAQQGLRGEVGNSLYFQVGANADQGISVSIDSINSLALGIGDGVGHATIDVLADSGTDISWQLDVLDEALSYVTTQRSKLGAVQNRMEYTQSSLDISAENLSNAESRIRDVDMAKEMTQFTKMNILFQASTAMLAQANALPQGVLQMLG
jgi:flagellin